MVQTIQFHRKAVLDLFRGPWTECWIATPRLDGEAVALLLPLLRRHGARVRVRVMTNLDASRVSEGKVDLLALQSLRSLLGCEVRHLPELAASVYVAGGALVTGAPLTLAGLDSGYAYGTVLPAEEAGAVVTDLTQWWSAASALSEEQWVQLAIDVSAHYEARSVADEIARLGGFVRVSVRGSRRSRRLDPKEFGVAEGEWGRAVRPVEVALYKLDDVIRAKEDLEALLAEQGLEWNGYYLVPRHFLERDWPRLFAARERQLRERLGSAEGKAALKAQLAQARRELEAFFGEIFPRADAEGMPAEIWVDMQTTRVLTETVSDTILADSGLEYRVLTILPEDARSVEEMQSLLQDPKLRSVQLTFHI